MKRLIVLRHAKAVSKATPDDHARVLAERGREQMKAVAKTLQDPELRPDIALVSTATRTRETWKRTKLAEVEARFEDAIYLAGVRTLLKLIRGLDDSVSRAMLVGHNPGLEDLALSLVGRDRDSADRLARGMPTAALAVIDLPVETWQEAGPGKGKLAAFVTAGE